MQSITYKYYMSNRQTLAKLAAYKKNPEVYQALSSTELADLVILVLSQVRIIQDQMETKRLDVEKKFSTPVEQVISKVQKDNKALIADVTREINALLSKGNEALNKTTTELEAQVKQAIANIRNGENGIVTEEEIKRAASIALEMLELPDFDALISENITTNGEAIRNALELLSDENRYKVEIADVQGLADALNQLGQVRSSQGGTIGKNQVYNFIREAIADGTITSSGSSTFIDLTDTPSSYTGQAGKFPKVNATEDGLEFQTIAGGGDMLAANNLSDVANTATARTNLGLGDSATKNVGTGAGTVAAGDHNHTGVYAPALGADDNYVTDAEKAALPTHVVGPASATDNAIARYDGTTGKLLQNSGVYIDDSGNMGIGDTTPSHKLDVNGKIGINGIQTIYHAGATGGFAGSLFVGNGGGSLSHTAGLEGYYNTGVGIGALLSNTTGTNNTAAGVNALYSNTTGTNNTAAGVNALYFNTTGYSNTASGMQALRSNTTGTNNTAAGVNALYSNTTGTNNTALGYQAGYGDGTADQRSVIDTNMTFLGFQASRDASVPSTTALTNGIAIGNGARVLASNQAVLGNDSITTTLLKGKVGVGTTTPYATLSLTNTGTNPSFLVEDSASPDSSPFVIDAGGNVGVGTTSPDTTLDVNGAITQRPLSADPSDPDAGNSVTWVSDGTGSGDAGDIMVKVNVGGTVKTITLIDWSSAT